MASCTMAAEGEGILTSKDANEENEREEALAFAELTAAQRARSERNRLRARQLRDSRLAPAPRPHTDGDGARARAPAPDAGGGFLPEERAEAPRPRAAAAAPIVDPAARPHCLECLRSFAQSYLMDAFEHPVCDECRDDADAHALVTRTEAKALYLLKDCDLDGREPPLRCVRRRNPHGARLGDMRLYLRPQLEARALAVWGSPAALEAERERREEARARTAQRRTRARLRALRMDVRSSLFERTSGAHQHEFGAERHDAETDEYSRECATCGHVQTYEKM